MGNSYEPVEIIGTVEEGCSTTIQAACAAVHRVAADATSILSPKEVLELAKTGAPTFVTGMPLIGAAANAGSVQYAIKAIKDVVADANEKMVSLLSRQIFDRAIAIEVEKHRAEVAALKKAARGVFDLADADGSGSLTIGEIRSFAVDVNEAQSILAGLDNNNDGRILVNEWEGFFVALHAASPEAAQMLLERSVRLIFERSFMITCVQLFEEFDKDRSGVLEMREVMMMIGDDDEGAELAAYLDADGDKVVSLDEWMGFLMGFWRNGPALARAIVDHLIQRAAELRMMPSMPPPSE